MKLSVCMIVRDNEHMIRECLESIRPWVDEMIVVDTGSKDATPQIAESLGAKLFQFEWIDDFSAARNVSLEHASGKWLFWMDSDDTISEECGRKLRALADGQHASNTFGYVMQVRCPAIGKNGIDEFTVVDHVKMFRNDPRVRFEGRIHEQVLMPIRRIGGEIAWTDIYVVHSGSDYSPEGQRRKSERDLRILQKDLEERPDHPFVLFNFAMTYAELGRYKEALPWVEKCLEVSQPYESHVRKTYAYLANCHSQLEQESQALDACRRGRELFPDDAELLFREAMSLHSLQRYDEAIARYRELLNLETSEELKSTDPSITGFKCRFNLGVCYSEAGKSPEAELQWREVLREHPSYRPALRSLTEQLRKDGKRIAARVEELDRTGENILLIIGSDHGHETTTEIVDMDDMLVAAGLKDSPDSREVAIAPQGTSVTIYLAPEAMDREGAIVEFLKGQPYVGGITHGADLAKLGMPVDELAPRIAVTGAATEEPNEFGVKGGSVAFQGTLKISNNQGCGQHGGLGTYEQSPFAMARGPLYQGGTKSGDPTCTVDLAPTVLRHLGLDYGDVDGAPLP